jgi:hypothetical protein
LRAGKSDAAEGRLQAIGGGRGGIGASPAMARASTSPPSVVGATPWPPNPSAYHTPSGKQPMCGIAWRTRRIDLDRRPPVRRRRAVAARTGRAPVAGAAVDRTDPWQFVNFHVDR